MPLFKNQQWIIHFVNTTRQKLLCDKLNCVGLFYTTEKKTVKRQTINPFKNTNKKNSLVKIVHFTQNNCSVQWRSCRPAEGKGILSMNFTCMEQELKDWPPWTNDANMRFTQPMMVPQSSRSFVELASHNINLLGLGKVENLFGPGAYHLVILTNGQERLKTRGKEMLIALYTHRKYTALLMA